MLSLFPEQELIQSGTLQFLLRAPTAQVILAFIAHGIRVRLNHNLQICLSGFLPQIHRHHDAKDVPYLIRDVFKQLFGILEADKFAFVILSDDQYAALSVGEATNPFEVFVSPRLFPLNGLMLAHVAPISTVALLKGTIIPAMKAVHPRLMQKLDAGCQSPT